MHMYSASKFAVTALTEGLRQELRAANSNIRVSVSAVTQECYNMAIISQCGYIDTSDMAILMSVCTCINQYDYIDQCGHINECNYCAHINDRAYQVVYYSN